MTTKHKVSLSPRGQSRFIPTTALFETQYYSEDSGGRPSLDGTAWRDIERELSLGGLSVNNRQLTKEDITITAEEEGEAEWFLRRRRLIGLFGLDYRNPQHYYLISRFLVFNQEVLKVIQSEVEKRSGGDASITGCKRKVHFSIGTGNTINIDYSASLDLFEQLEGPESLKFTEGATFNCRMRFNPRNASFTTQEVEVDDILVKYLLLPNSISMSPSVKIKNYFERVFSLSLSDNSIETRHDRCVESFKYFIDSIPVEQQWQGRPASRKYLLRSAVNAAMLDFFYSQKRDMKNAYPFATVLNDYVKSIKHHFILKEYEEFDEEYKDFVRDEIPLIVECGKQLSALYADMRTLLYPEDAMDRLELAEEGIELVYANKAIIKEQFDAFEQRQEQLFEQQEEGLVTHYAEGVRYTIRSLKNSLLANLEERHVRTQYPMFYELKRELNAYLSHDGRGWGRSKDRHISKERRQRVELLLALADSAEELERDGLLTDDDYHAFMRAMYDIKHEHAKERSFWSNRLGDALERVLPLTYREAVTYRFSNEIFSVTASAVVAKNLAESAHVDRLRYERGQSKVPHYTQVVAKRMRTGLDSGRNELMCSWYNEAWDRLITCVNDQEVDGVYRRCREDLEKVLGQAKLLRVDGEKVLKYKKRVDKMAKMRKFVLGKGLVINDRNLMAVVWRNFDYLERLQAAINDHKFISVVTLLGEFPDKLLEYENVMRLPNSFAWGNASFALNASVLDLINQAVRAAERKGAPQSERLQRGLAFLKGVCPVKEGTRIAVRECTVYYSSGGQAETVNARTHFLESHFLQEDYAQQVHTEEEVKFGEVYRRLEQLESEDTFELSLLLAPDQRANLTKVLEAHGMDETHLAYVKAIFENKTLKASRKEYGIVVEQPRPQVEQPTEVELPQLDQVVHKLVQDTMRSALAECQQELQEDQPNTVAGRLSDSPVAIFGDKKQSTDGSSTSSLDKLETHSDSDNEGETEEQRRLKELKEAAERLEREADRLGIGSASGAEILSTVAVI